MPERIALSVDEVAAMLGVGRDAIYRAVKRGEILSLKIGARVLIPRVWLDRLVADATAEPEKGQTFT